VGHEEVLHGVQGQGNVLQAVKRRKANRIGHMLRWNCLLRHVIGGKVEGGIEVTGIRGIRGKQLPDDLKERRGCCKLKEDVVGRTVWRNDCGRGCGHVLRQTAG
jgi:hypothetical protein